MRYQWLILLASMISVPAWAVCPAHEPTITASATGGFRLCAPETDQDGDPVTASFYQSCTVNVTWGGGAKTAFATLTSITPGAPMVVGFPAAKGPGTAIGFCTNSDGVTTPGAGGTASSALTFRAGYPGKPGMSK